jgi:hypothetical protein
MQQESGSGSWIMADGHVHLHDSFVANDFFTAARNNFYHYREALHLTGKIHFFLLLTESANTEAFLQLRDGQKQIPGWNVHSPADATSLLIEPVSRDTTLFVIAGRQIVTAESLEVLALGLDAPCRDGKPLQVILQELRDSNSLTVLPWGAGKWLGKRGRIIRQTVNAAVTPDFYLGDNGNRPFFWPKPAVFKQAAAKGIADLAGSDPLPFINQEKRPGSFGFYLPAAVDRQHPFQSLRQHLEQADNSPSPFGRTGSTWSFFHLQISMQLSKLYRKRSIQ